MDPKSRAAFDKFLVDDFEDSYDDPKPARSGQKQTSSGAPSYARTSSGDPYADINLSLGSKKPAAKGYGGFSFDDEDEHPLRPKKSFVKKDFVKGSSAASQKATGRSSKGVTETTASISSISVDNSVSSDNSTLKSTMFALSAQDNASRPIQTDDLSTAEGEGGGGGGGLFEEMRRQMMQSVNELREDMERQEQKKREEEEQRKRQEQQKKREEEEKKRLEQQRREQKRLEEEEAEAAARAVTQSKQNSSSPRTATADVDSDSMSPIRSESPKQTPRTVSRHYAKGSILLDSTSDAEEEDKRKFWEANSDPISGVTSSSTFALSVTQSETEGVDSAVKQVNSKSSGVTVGFAQFSPSSQVSASVSSSTSIVPPLKMDVVKQASDLQRDTVEREKLVGASFGSLSLSSIASSPGSVVNTVPNQPLTQTLAGMGGPLPSLAGSGLQLDELSRFKKESEKQIQDLKQKVYDLSQALIGEQKSKDSVIKELNEERKKVVELTYELKEERQKATAEREKEKQNQVRFAYVESQLQARIEELLHTDPRIATASVESLTTKIQILEEDKRLLTVQLEQERNRFTSELAAIENRHRSEFEKKTEELRHENYALSVKLREKGEVGARVMFSNRHPISDGHSSMPNMIHNNIKPVLTDEEQREIEKELQMQETLIRGYQKENERLMRDVTALKETIKELHRSMYMENERVEFIRRSQGLGADVSTVSQTDFNRGQAPGVITISPVRPRSQFDSAVIQTVHDDEMTRNKIKNLEWELENSKRVMERKSHDAKVEIDRYKQANEDLEKTLREFKIQSKKLESQRIQELNQELDRVRNNARQEVIDLEKKLRWYKENQDLIDKSEEKMKIYKMANRNLKVVLKNIITKLGQKFDSLGISLHGVQLDADETTTTALLLDADGESILDPTHLDFDASSIHRTPYSAPGSSHTTAASGLGLTSSHKKDVKRIKELESKVKELTEALVKRNPNSIAALIQAAKPSLEESELVAELKRRIASLESDAAETEQDTEKRIRALRQDYDRMKTQFEKKLEEVRRESAGKGKVGFGLKLDKVDEREKESNHNSKLISANEREGYELRIKDLEKLVEDTKSFYQKKLKVANDRKDGGSSAKEGSVSTGKPTNATTTTDLAKAKAAVTKTGSTVAAKRNGLKSSSSLTNGTLKGKTTSIGAKSANEKEGNTDALQLQSEINRLTEKLEIKNEYIEKLELELRFVQRESIDDLFNLSTANQRSQNDTRGGSAVNQLPQSGLFQLNGDIMSLPMTQKELDKKREREKKQREEEFCIGIRQLLASNHGQTWTLLCSSVFMLSECIVDKDKEEKAEKILEFLMTVIENATSETNNESTIKTANTGTFLNGQRNGNDNGEGGANEFSFLPYGANSTGIVKPKLFASFEFIDRILDLCSSLGERFRAKTDRKKTLELVISFETMIDKELNRMVKLASTEFVVDKLDRIVCLSAMDKQNKMPQVKRDKSGSFQRAHLRLVQERGLESLFEKLDVNEDGYVGKNELLQVLRELGISLLDEEVDRLLRTFDINKDGNISFVDLKREIEKRQSKRQSQFDVLYHKYLQPSDHADPLAALRTFPEDSMSVSGLMQRLADSVGFKRNGEKLDKKAIIKRAKVAFSHFDINEDGLISKEEFRQVLKEYNIHLSDQDLNQLVNRFDQRRIGSISYKDFLKELSRVGESVPVAYMKGTGEGATASKRVVFEETLLQRLAKEINLRTKRGPRFTVDLRAELARVDGDGDQRINMQEFWEAIQNMNLDMTREEVSLLFKYFLSEDKNTTTPSGGDSFVDSSEYQLPTVDYTNIVQQINHEPIHQVASELVNGEPTSLGNVPSLSGPVNRVIQLIAESVKTQRISLENAFDAADLNQDGTVSVRELRRILQTLLRLNIGDLEIQLLVQQFGSSNVNRIGYRNLLHRVAQYEGWTVNQTAFNAPVGLVGYQPMGMLKQELQDQLIHSRRQCSELEHELNRVRNMLSIPVADGNGMRGDYRNNQYPIGHGSVHISDPVEELRQKLTATERQLRQQMDENQKLLEEISRLGQSPSAFQFDMLKRQIEQIESRHVSREQELQRLLTETQSRSQVELSLIQQQMETERQRFQFIIDSKNEEINRFRLELDGFLSHLGELRKQGVLV